MHASSPFEASLNITEPLASPWSAHTNRAQLGSSVRVFQVRKRSGGTRTVYAPSDRAKRRYRQIAGRILEVYQLAGYGESAHGFLPGRSPITNAQKHVGYAFTLTIDLADCFDHVTEEYLTLGPEHTPLIRSACVHGAARQGLPSSPIACNLALESMDLMIRGMIAPSTAYTRYADDLTFSSDSLAALLDIRDRIPEIARLSGQYLNPKKTRIQYAGYGRRIVTGIAVDDDGIHPTRAAKRRLRAARHRARRTGTKRDRDRARGLAEWCKLRRPKAERALSAGSKILRVQIQDATEEKLG